MNTIPKEKRKPLLLVAILTLAVIAGWWLVVISPQLGKLDRLSVTTADAQEKLDTMRKAVANAPKLAAELEAALAKLQSQEKDMPSGDLFLRLTETIRGLAPGYNVEVPQFSPPVTGDVNLFPKFPYKQALIGVGGTAHYHNFGIFLADLENRFPGMRVQNLELEPAPSATLVEKEKLSFRMEIAALIKPAL